MTEDLLEIPAFLRRDEKGKSMADVPPAAVAVATAEGAKATAPAPDVAAQAAVTPSAFTIDSDDDLCFPHHFKMETLPQLCERAMREVGAIKGPMPVGPLIPIHPNGGYMTRETMVLPGKTVEDNVEVRCIPVPEGYRK